MNNERIPRREVWRASSPRVITSAGCDSGPSKNPLKLRNSLLDENCARYRCEISGRRFTSRVGSNRRGRW
jgi:hypothetical protein